jgi:hypothetical protein
MGRVSALRSVETLLDDVMIVIMMMKNVIAKVYK